MDKETLSNYGWIVICVLVLAVMIALATPFGKFISNAVQNTTQGLFDVNQKALNQTGLITIEDQEFDVPDMNHDANTPVVVAGSATFNKQLTEGCDCIETYGIHECWITIEPVTLTWEELKLAENGTMYGYNASEISGTEVGYVFDDCYSITNIVIPKGITRIKSFYGAESLTSITIPDSVTTIDEFAFSNTDLTNITFEGTTAQWNAITFGEEWNDFCSEITVTCTDGTITIPEND